MSSEINEHVLIETTQASAGNSRAGFGTLGIASCNVTWPERSRSYSDEADAPGDGMPVGSPEYLAIAAAFAQEPRPETVKILRCLGKPTLQYRIDIIGTPTTAGITYRMSIQTPTVAETFVSYTPQADATFTFSSATDIATQVAHGEVDGAGPYRLSNAGGALPTGLAVDTDYYLHVLSVDTYQFATTKANALAGTVINASTDGTGTQTLRRAENDVIVAQLVAQANAIAGKNYTAASVTGAGETDYGTITGSTAGAWFSVAVEGALSGIKIEVVHASPATTLSADLDAINEEDSNWYGLQILYPSDAMVKDAAAWCESHEKIFVQAMSDSTIVTGGDGSGDTASDLKALSRVRTAIMYHFKPAQMAGCAWNGRVLPTEPGRATWKFKTLSGVTSNNLTTTQRANIRAKRANTYRIVGQTPWTWEGTMCFGKFIDQVRNIDWLDDALAVRMSNTLSTNDSIAYTERGLNVLLADVDAVLTEATRRGVLSDDASRLFTISHTPIDEVDEDDREGRYYPDIFWDGYLGNSIHKVRVRGAVRV